MYLSTLDDWLAWIANLHTTEIELSLDRVRTVAARLDLLAPQCTVIIVGGTNGKGSTVAALEALYRTMGYRVGAFTSPILFKHNEQVRINGVEASDQMFCHAFEAVAAALQDVTLTPFEFGTLAALCIFKQYPLDVLILEVGLGGRLDAVNILDADVAVVTSISIDHVEWLGPTREAIGFEKAGIFRSGRPAVCGDMDPPQTLLDHAEKLGTTLYCQGRDFQYHVADRQWSWESGNVSYTALPISSLAMQNMATALMTMHLLQSRLPVNRAAIDLALQTVHVPGRVEIIPGDVTEIYDVSHNFASIALLADKLANMPCDGKTYAVFSMLADKDMRESIKVIREQIDAWYVAPLKTKRATDVSVMEKIFSEAKIEKVTIWPSIEDALVAVRGKANVGDRIVVFGSFHTITEARMT